MSELPLLDLGFGTYQAKGDSCRNAVEHALEVGYRLIDTAACYGNHDQVALGIEDSKVPRKDIFITSKIHPKDMKSEQKVYEAGLKILQELKMEQLDCLLLHWPALTGIDVSDPSHVTHRKNAWKALIRLHTEGKCRFIGVSNFEARHLEELASMETPFKPHVNQVEFHPFFLQKELIHYCEEHDIIIQGYSTLARAAPLLLTHPVLVTISEAHQKTPAQILLRWSMQQRIPVIPKSIHLSRIESNFLVNDFVLNDEEMDQLSSLHCDPKCVTLRAHKECNCGVGSQLKEGEPDEIIFQEKQCWNPTHVN